MSTTCTITWWELVGSDGFRCGVGRTPALARLRAREILRALYDDEPELVPTQLDALTPVQVRLQGVPERMATTVACSVLDWQRTPEVRDFVVVRRSS